MRGIRKATKVLVTVALAAMVGAAALAPAASSSIETLPSITKALLLDIARVAPPPPGIGLRIHADFPDGAELDLGGLPLHSLTADITPLGGVQVIEAHAASSSTGSTNIDPCQDRTFVPMGVKWRAGDLPVEWRFRMNSTPSDMGQSGTRYALKKAHRTWTDKLTNCKERDEINFRFKYAGTTGKSPGYDGINMIDFGKLGSKALAVNYTWFKDGRILEVDMRLNKTDYRWRQQTTTKPNRYIVSNVAAHEIGHQIGLADLSDPHGGLTMFARISAGETSKTRLGRGDIKGASFVSP